MAGRLEILKTHLKAPEAQSSPTAAAVGDSVYILRSAANQMQKYGREEWVLRCKLAVAYRIAHHEGWDQWIFNHITVKIPSSEKLPGGPHFLIGPFGLRFDEMTASALLKVNLKGDVVDPGLKDGPLLQQGFVVHSSVHMARPDLHAVWHCHHKDSTAVSMTKTGLLPLSQEALLFFPGKISYHPFEGSATDPEERPRMAKNLGKENKVMMLENHGPLTSGENLEEAFTLMAVLTRACSYQYQAMAAAGGDLSKLRVPPESQMREMAKRMQQQTDPAEAKIAAKMLNLLMFRSVARRMESLYGAENIYK